MLGYDPKSVESILKYAKRLQGTTLAALVDEAAFTKAKAGHKGAFGNLVETAYFGLKANNASRPDFEEAGLELKTSPLEKIPKGTRIKERLVLGLIDFDSVIDETWESSSFLAKNQKLLLMFYWHQDEEGPELHKFELIDLWTLLDVEDALLIEQDWKNIVAKVREGRAHEISEGDTFLLGACTKGANAASLRSQPKSSVRAMQRAFSFKPRYMKTIFDRLRGVESEGLEKIVSAAELRKKPFEKVIEERFKPYIGKTYEQICKAFGVAPTKSKAQFDAISHRIMGAKGKKIAEFEKAEVTMRTIRLKANGVPKEDISFPYFKYRELVQECWEDATLRDQLEHKFFFVLYRIGKHGPVLEGVRFWTMPQADIEGPVREAWIRTITQIRADECDDLPKKSAGYPIHVRPHARDGQDKDRGLYQKSYVKKSFWLTGAYLVQALGFQAGR